MSSAPPVLRRALLEKRLPALCRILCERHKRDQGEEVLERSSEIHVLLRVKRVASQPHDRSRLLSQALSQTGCLLIQAVGRHDAVDEPVLLELSGRPSIPHHHHQHLARKVSAEDSLDHHRPTPTLISGVPNVAVSTATSRSQAHARPNPPAKAWPLIRPTIGLPSSAISMKSSASAWRPSCSSSGDLSPPNPLRSAPAQKARSPAPVITTTAIAGSALHQASATRRSRIIAAESGLRCSGRFIVRVAIAPLTPTRTSDSAGRLLISTKRAGDGRPSSRGSRFEAG